MEPRINELIISSHCHITENPNRVKKAILNIIPPELRSALSSKLTVEKVYGFYGNEIRILSLRVQNDEAVKVIRYLAETLSGIDRSVIRASLDLRYDSKSNKLYLRFNKQQAYKGRFVIDDSDDVVKVIISFRGRHKLDDIKSLLKDLGLI